MTVHLLVCKNSETVPVVDQHCTGCPGMPSRLLLKLFVYIIVAVLSTKFPQFQNTHYIQLRKQRS